MLWLVQAWSPIAVKEWNTPAWTLSVEAFFYAVFSLVGTAVARLGPRQLLLSMAAFWLAALAGPFVYVVSNGPASATPWQSVVFYNPVLHLPQFLIGVAAGCLYIRAGSSRHSGALAVGSLVVSLLVLGQELPLPDLLFNNGLLAVVFAALLYGLASGGNLAARVLGWRPVVVLGEASYAMYILRAPVWLWSQAVGLTLRADLIPLADRPFFVVNLAVLIAMSLFASRYIEGPARRWLRHAFASPDGQPRERAGPRLATNHGSARRGTVLPRKVANADTA